MADVVVGAGGGLGLPAARLSCGLSGRLSGSGVGVAFWPCGGVVTGPGWSGRAGPGRAAGGLEQVQPPGLPVPAAGQVQGEVGAAVPGDPGGEVDQAGPDGGAFGPGVAGGGPGAAGAGRGGGGGGRTG